MYIFSAKIKKKIIFIFIFIINIGILTDFIMIIKMVHLIFER